MGISKLLNSERVRQTSTTSDIAFTHSVPVIDRIGGLLNNELLFESPRLTFKQQRPHKSWREQMDAAIARKYWLLQSMRKPAETS